MVAAAASKPTLPLIPKIVSPTWISLPIAYLEANLFNFSMHLCGKSCSLLTATNSPLEKVNCTCCSSFFCNCDG